MKNLLWLSLLLAALCFVACVDEKETDIEKPSIELISPAPCDTLAFGASFVFSVKLTDNTGLGHISMDVHNNFGHHDHGAHEGCNYDTAKEAMHPFANDWQFELPQEQLVFTFDTLLSLPALKGDSIEFDPGDYHFHIYLTDNDGYLTFTTLDVKILN